MKQNPPPGFVIDQPPPGFVLDSAQSNAPQQRSALDEAGRVVGRTVRLGLTGALGIPLAITDAATAGINKVLPDKYQLTPASKSLHDILTMAGVARPETAAERVFDDAGAAITGVGSLAKSGQYIPKLGEFAKNLGSQVTAATTGSLASGAVREGGGGEGAQLAAGVLGGFTPAAAAGTVRRVYGPAARARTSGKLLNKVAMEGGKGPRAEAARQKVLDSLDNAKSQVPGEPVTTAKAAVSARQPAFTAAAKKIPEAHGPARAEELSAAAKTARDKSLSTIAKTPEDLKKANAVAKTISSKAYERAEKSGISVEEFIRVEPRLTKLMERPSMVKAAREAKELALEGDVVERGLIGDLQTSKRIISRKLKGIQAEDRKVGATSDEARTLSKTLEEIRDVVGQLSPDAKKADLIHARLKREPNRMRLGQKLEKVLRKPLSGEDRGEAFAKTLDDLDDAAIKSTGFPVNLRPDQRNALEGIRGSLAREADVKSQATKGSNNMELILEGVLKPIETPNILHRVATVGRSIMQKIGLATKETTLKELAETLKDPKAVAALMRAAPRDMQFEMMRILREGAKDTGKALVGPSARNALSGATQVQVQNSLQGNR